MDDVDVVWDHLQENGNHHKHIINLKINVSCVLVPLCIPERLFKEKPVGLNQQYGHIEQKARKQSRAHKTFILMHHLPRLESFEL